MDINLTISPAPGITTDYLVVAVYSAGAPTVLVQSVYFAAPHTSPQNISFTGLDDVPHYVTIFQNTTTTAGGTIRHHFLYDPSYQTAIIKDDLVLVADTTPGFFSGSLTYTDAPNLSGWNFSIERRGFGALIKGVDFSFDTTTSTFTLLATAENPTPTIAPGEIFIVHFLPKIVTVTPTSNPVAGVIFSDCFTVSADISLDTTHMGKCGLIAGATDHLTVTLPSLSGIPENKLLAFISEGGFHVNAVIKAAGTDSIKFNGTTTRVIIGQSERISFFKKNNAWNIAFLDGNFKTVGEVFEGYSTSVLNAVFCNGQSLSRATYSRLWAYVQTLDASMLVSDSEWNNVALKNKGKFSMGDGSTTFRVPLLYKTVDGAGKLLSSAFTKGVDGSTKKAGDWEDESVKVATDIKGVKVTGSYTAAGAVDSINPTGQEFDLGHVFDIGTGSKTYTEPAASGLYKMMRA